VARDIAVTVIKLRDAVDTVLRWLHPWIWVTNAIVIIAIATLVGMAFDRRPPIVLVPMEPITVKAGEWAHIEVLVQKLNLNCNVTYSRYLLDSAGTKFDIGGQQEQGAEDVAQAFGFQMPPLQAGAKTGGVALGPATIAMPITAICNKGHYLWPVHHTLVIPLLVVAP
jgi:hypothetical protein